ncbi:flagellar motor switch protein FliG [Thalassococcus sp. BH17M4-6]|uniref:flagellar motor switch protein FliG n=1 Tax=Thalassococcus sp. BH17M4-6 TaxID=3413148 RepID=UPI003BE7D5EE
MTKALSLAAAPSAPAAAPPVPLSRRAKAAIIVQFILNEGTDVPLSSLPDALQAQLTQQLGSMRYVDRATLNAVVLEFADELESVGLSFPGDMAGALYALDGKISPQTAQRLRKEAGVRQIGDPWQRLAALDLETLERLIQSESTEVAAVMISKLDVAKAAGLLGRLPGAKARRITYAVSMTGGVTPDAVERIGLSLASQIDAEPARAFAGKPVDRVGAILNYSRANIREDVLTGLEETDRDFAEAVRRAIFTFPNIPDRLNPTDVPKISRDVDAAVISTAIAAATSEEDQRAVDFLTDNMSKRMAAALREEAAERGTVKAKVGEEAMNAIVTAIRNLVASGEITLLSAGDEEDDAG